MAARRQFCRQRLADPKAFDRRSFRTEALPRGHRLVIGCPIGNWNHTTKRCKVGTRAQSLLHPLREGKCPPGKFEMKKRQHQAEGFGLHLPGEAIYMTTRVGGLVAYRGRSGKLLYKGPFEVDSLAYKWARDHGLTIEAKVDCP